MAAPTDKPVLPPAEELPDDASEAETPELSLVVPGLNEAESLPELTRRIHEAIGDDHTYELLFVDDGSTDDTWKVIRKLRRKYPAVRGIRLRDNFGKATALSAGFSRVRGRLVITMDADLQDDPADLPTFLEQLDADLDVVVGWKVNRLDPLNRRVLSKVFNGTVARMTGVRLHDMNCGFKGYRREVIHNLPIYGDIFRFIPVLAKWRGFRIGEVPVKHHARQYGRSRYGLERILRGLFDLMTVMFLTRFSTRPMHLFGLLGLLMSVAGFGVCAYLTVLWVQGHQIGSRPLLLLGVLLIILGIQFFSIGLIGEFLTFTHSQRHDRQEHPIREELG